MHEAQPQIYRSVYSLHMGLTSFDTLRAEPFQIVFNGLDFDLKLDWNTLMPTTTANVSFLFFFSSPLMTNSNQFILVEVLTFY